MVDWALNIKHNLSISVEYNPETPDSLSLKKSTAPDGESKSHPLSLTSLFQKNYFLAMKPSKGPQTGCKWSSLGVYVCRRKS